MTTQTDDRAEFEAARGPVPDGVYWNGQEYDCHPMSSPFYSSGSASASELFQREWTVWQSARAQQAEAEPVAWQALMFGEWGHCNNALLRHIDFLPAHLKPPVRPVFAAPPTPAPVVPEGYKVQRVDGRTITVDTPDGGGCVLFDGERQARIQALYDLLSAMLSSAPSPDGQEGG